MLSGTVTVESGDTLGRISASVLGAKKLWPSLWWVNRHRVPNPDMISPGEILILPRHPALPGWLMKAAARALPRPPAAPAPSHVGSSGGTSNSAPPPVVSSAPVSTAGMAGFEACVISRESGGNPEIWNPTGHWGLFQFDLGTWESGGGSAAEFGHADAAVQEQVFARVFAARGTEPWAPSDGC